MKYQALIALIALTVSFSAMADPSGFYDPKPELTLDKARLIINQLTYQNNQMVDYINNESSSEGDYIAFNKAIASDCINGYGFSSKGAGGFIYRFTCNLVEVVR